MISKKEAINLNSKKIFISYSRANKLTLKSLVSDLNELGYDNVWFDKHIENGQKWWDEILDNIEKAEIFILLLSQESLNSIYCTAEYQYANALGVKCLYILINKDSYNTLPIEFKQLNLLEYFERNLESIMQLSRSLKKSFENTNKLPSELIKKRPVLPLSDIEKFQLELQKNELTRSDQNNLFSELCRFTGKENLSDYQIDQFLNVIQSFKNRFDSTNEIINLLNTIKIPKKMKFNNLEDNKNSSKNQLNKQVTLSMEATRKREIRALMDGNVLNVFVKVKDIVGRDEVIANMIVKTPGVDHESKLFDNRYGLPNPFLESIIPIKAPFTGAINSISISPQDAVKKGQILAIIELLK